MAWGMKRVPGKMSTDPALYLHAMLNPFVAMGIAALILAFLTRVTAIGYVISVFIGKLFLHETITVRC